MEKTYPTESAIPETGRATPLACLVAPRSSARRQSAPQNLRGSTSAGRVAVERRESWLGRLTRGSPAHPKKESPPIPAGRRGITEEDFEPAGSHGDIKGPRRAPTESLQPKQLRYCDGELFIALSTARR